MRLAFLLVLSACSLNSDFTGTYYACGPDGECPDDYICVHQFCTPPQPAPTTCSSRAAAGGSHTCMVRDSDGPVWCGGRNNHNHPGNGQTADSSTPVQVT